MPVIKQKIELSENELKDILAKHFKLDDDSTLSIVRHEKDRPFDSEFTTITIEGVKKDYGI